MIIIKVDRDQLQAIRTGLSIYAAIKSLTTPTRNIVKDLERKLKQIWDEGGKHGLCQWWVYRDDLDLCQCAVAMRSLQGADS